LLARLSRTIPRDAPTKTFIAEDLVRKAMAGEIRAAPGFVREPGCTCNVRSSEETELFAGGIFARTAAKGVAEPSS